MASPSDKKCGNTGCEKPVITEAICFRCKKPNRAVTFSQCADCQWYGIVKKNDVVYDSMGCQSCSPAIVKEQLRAAGL
jgi:hypothetical protein